MDTVCRDSLDKSPRTGAMTLWHRERHCDTLIIPAISDGVLRL